MTYDDDAKNRQQKWSIPAATVPITIALFQKREIPDPI